MNIAILGYGKQGKSSYDYWNKLGHSITICDDDETLVIPENASGKLGKDYLEDLDVFDLIVRTPKLHPDAILIANPFSTNILKKVTSNTNEFFRVCPTKNIIGVTGTKGKGTTCSLIVEMLRANGIHTHLGGNIGTPPLELLDNDIQPDDWVVLELANFQLIDCQYSPHIGVVLMIDNEHLDWHQDFNEYEAAKANLIAHQKPEDIAIYYGESESSERIAKNSQCIKIPYFSKPGAHIINNRITVDGTDICAVEEVGLLGKHNIQNICAALTAVWQVHHNVEALAGVVRNFKALPFRLEHRQKINEIDYYNDSFSSNPSATIAAIHAIAQPQILILGGKDRGLDLSSLIKTIGSAENIKTICLIGEAAQRLADECTKVGFKNFKIIPDKDILSIVKKAQALAVKGDAIVLSPGFPSFDMFKDFEDRGNQFNAALTSLNPYRQFIFESYEYVTSEQKLNLHYSIDSMLHFTESYQFQTKMAVPENPKAFARACELLFLMAGVSYYKTYLPNEIVINNISLDKELANFFQKTYQKGLGEFFYVNGLDPSTQIKFPITANAIKPIPFTYNNGKLIGIGGGKDSLLSLELMRDDMNIETWACNHEGKLAPLVQKIGTKHTSVLRKWDSQLTTLNTSGAYNGHIPISAILACVGVALAALTGKQDIIVSNESSSNAPTLMYQNHEINHQYSKSLEFEQDFQAILMHLFSGTKRYYSLLRPLTELAIAEKFAPHFDTFASVFCSCNKAFTQTSKNMTWCGKCAKCAFTYLIFAPFIPQEKLNSLFGGKNLLLDPELLGTYEQLLGIRGYKPLECIGEVEECRIAHSMVITQGIDSLPLEYELPIHYDYKTLHQDSIPENIKTYISF